MSTKLTKLELQSNEILQNRHDVHGDNSSSVHEIDIDAETWQDDKGVIHEIRNVDQPIPAIVSGALQAHASCIWLSNRHDNKKPTDIVDTLSIGLFIRPFSADFDDHEMAGAQMRICGTDAVCDSDGILFFDTDSCDWSGLGVWRSEISYFRPADTKAHTYSRKPKTGFGRMVQAMADETPEMKIGHPVVFRLAAGLQWSRKGLTTIPGPVFDRFFTLPKMSPTIKTKVLLNGQ